MVGLGRFISATIATTLACKRWWQLEQRLLVTTDPEAAGTVLDQLDMLGRAEVANCEAVIPLLEADSRLGWEPSMGYLGDAEHVRWKLGHLHHALDHQIPADRQTLDVGQLGS